MATTTKRLEITLTETTDPSGLFAGEADMAGVDVQASMERFDALLRDKVQEVFPDATVELGSKGHIWELTDDGENGENTTLAWEAQQAIQQYADDILNSGDWIVKAKVELRERGIYTLPGYGDGIELIACGSEGEDGGWVLYDRTEWDSASQAGLESDEDGNLTWWGSRNDAGNRTIAALVDTGRTES